MPTNTLPPNAIPVAKAVIWVNKWRAQDPRILPLKGFVIPKIDLTEVLGEEPTSVRTYMAIDPDDEGENTKYHLLIVGVDSAGNDMLDPDLEQYVYDFTRPCPSICSNTGPLQ